MHRCVPWLESKTKTIFHHLLWLVALSVLYWLIFLIPLPPQFKKQGILLTDEFLLLVLLILVFLTYQQSGWGAKYLRLGLVLLAFTLPLLRLWQTAESTWNIVLGLLPWMDARGYYSDATGLMNGSQLSSFSGRRPLFASLLAVLLKFSSQNLQIALIVFTTINALVVFLFTEEVRAEFGTVSAIAALYLSQLFYRPYVGTMLTEQLGFPVGLLAVIVLMRSVKTTRLWLFSLGIILLTYALLIRAGTFFVLPLLILFAVINFSENRQQYLKVSLIMLMAVAIPVLSNAWLGRMVASPNAVEFANFADTLYGQAKGGVRWTQAAIDHPELNSMTEPDRSRYLYGLAFDEIKRNPFGFVKGSLKAVVDFILPGLLSAFGFLTLGNKAFDVFFQVFGALIFLLGLWKLWIDRKNRTSTFMLVYWAGTLFSIPFLPPIDAGIRPYAATIASLFLPVCYVFSRPLFKHVENSQHEFQTIPLRFSSSLGFMLILLSLIGGPWIKAVAKPALLQPAVCASDLAPINFRITHGSYILLSSANNGLKTKVPVVSLSDVHASFDDFPYGDFASIIRKIKQPALVAAVNDISSGEEKWIIASPELARYEDQVVSACAKSVSQAYPILSIETVVSH